MNGQLSFNYRDQPFWNYCYLGNCDPSLQYLEEKGQGKCRPQFVRSFFQTCPEEFLLQDIQGLHCISDVQVDHILARIFGGPDPPCNPCCIPKQGRLNQCF